MVALTFYIEFDRLDGKMRGYAIGNARLDFVQAEYFAAGRAFEMRVLVFGVAQGQLKTPGAVFSHDGMHKVVFHKPVKDAVQGHAVKRRILGQCVQQLMVRERKFRFQQDVQYGNTGRGGALPNLMYHSFGFVHSR